MHTTEHERNLLKTLNFAQVDAENNAEEWEYVRRAGTSFARAASALIDAVHADHAETKCREVY